MICPSRKSLICRTNVNSNCLNFDMGGGREEGAGDPDLPLENYKLSFIFKKKNWYELPSRSNPPAPVGVVWIRTRMSGFYFHFLHVAGLAIISRANCLRRCAGWSALLLFACNKVEFLAITYIYTEYANLSINLAIKQDAFSNIFVLSQSKQLLRCSLVYYTQPHRGAISFLT